MIARAAVATALSLAGTLGASPARADGAETASGTAEALANEAYEQHAAGKYPEAISSYLKAFEISKSGVILFNVATIYDKKMHERDLAADYFRRYLRAPDAEPELVQKANQRLATLKQEADEEERKRAALPVVLQPTAGPPAADTTKVSAPTAATKDEGVTETSRPLRPVGVVVGAVGVASLATSAVLAVIAKGKNDDANALCNGQECSSDRGVTLASQAGTMATASTVTFVAGVTLLVGGVTLYFAAPRRVSSPSTAHLTVAPDVGLARAGMTLRGRF